MATSSLFKTFTIEGSTEVENFVRMLDTEPVPITAFDVSRVNDSDEAWRVMQEAAKSMNFTRKAGN